MPPELFRGWDDEIAAAAGKVEELEVAELFVKALHAGAAAIRPVGEQAFPLFPQLIEEEGADEGEVADVFRKIREGEVVGLNLATLEEREIKLVLGFEVVEGEVCKIGAQDETGKLVSTGLKRGVVAR